VLAPSGTVAGDVQGCIQACLPHSGENWKKFG
jgi:hypothetical protein